MKYKIRPHYGTMKPGAKPQKYFIVDENDIPVDTFLFEADAKRALKRMNKKTEYKII